MRIELVVDVPGISNPDAVDAIRLGNEVVRLVRGDLGDLHAELVHVAVGSDISVPRDFDPVAPIVSVESTDIVHDPSAITPHAEDFHVAAFTPYHVGEPEEEEPVLIPADDELLALLEDHRFDYDAAWDEAHAEPQPVDAEGNLIPVPVNDPFNSVTDHGAPTED